jgi:hypothetical protein
MHCALTPTIGRVHRGPDKPAVVANAIGHSDDRAGVSANDDPIGRSGEGSRKLGLTPEGMMGGWKTIWVLDSAGRGQSS